MKRKLIIIIIAAVMILSLSITVIIVSSKNKEPATYSVTVTNGTGGGEYAEGATVKIKANAPETGKEFTSWTINGVSVDDKTKAEITFTMPANAVTATANYGDKAYLFALENCTADKETAKFGEEVTFTADEIIGKRFDSWNIKGVDDLTGLDLTKSPLTITMPANDINVAAVLEDIDYTVSVTGGTTDKETAHYGDTVTITANAPATGMHFTGWTLNGVTVEDNTVAELNFRMPAGNVTATANYAAHTFGAWTEKTPAGVHKDKVEKQLCTVCGYEETRTVDGTALHSYSDTWSKNETQHWHESTCAGHNPPLKTDIAAHTYGAWTEKTPAGVHVDKVENRTCTACGYEETKKVEGTALHTYSNTWSKSETQHWRESTCAGHNPPLKPDVAEHTGTWTVKTPADYGQNRVETRTCSVCDYTEEREVEGTMLQPKPRTITIPESFGDYQFNGMSHLLYATQVEVTNKEGGMVIDYRKLPDEEWTTTPPKAAGQYEVRVTLNGTKEWAECVETKAFEIKPAVLKLTNDTFVTDNSGEIYLTEFDVSGQYYNWTDYVHVEVPAQYQKPGRHTIPVSELFTDDDCFAVGGYFTEVKLVVYDTAEFYGGVENVNLTPSNTVLITTTVERGTLKKGDTVYIQELAKSVTVVGISLVEGSKTVDKATVGDRINFTFEDDNPAVTTSQIKKGHMLTASTTSLSSYKIFKVTVRAYTEAEGGQSISSRNAQVLTFVGVDTLKDCNLAFSGTLAPGQTLENVTLTFTEAQLGFVGRKFYIKSGENIIAECVVTECLTRLTFTGGAATTGSLSYQSGESKTFVVGLGAPTAPVTFAFAISDTTNFRVKVFDKSGHEVALSQGKLSLVGGTAIADYTVVVTNIGTTRSCELTITPTK